MSMSISALNTGNYDSNKHDDRTYLNNFKKKTWNIVSKTTLSYSIVFVASKIIECTCKFSSFSDCEIGDYSTAYIYDMYMNVLPPGIIFPLLLFIKSAYFNKSNKIKVFNLLVFPTFVCTLFDMIQTVQTKGTVPYGFCGATFGFLSIVAISKAFFVKCGVLY